VSDSRARQKPGLYPDGSLVLPLFDVMRTGCGIDVEVNTATGRIRFQATEGDRRSPWSPMYSVDVLPETLSWDDLW
jgi:hypothetical protein